MQFTLTLAGLSASAAERSASVLEDAATPPLAIARNEIDEDKGLWEIIAYFASETDARMAARLFPDAEPVIASLPDIDWVRRSLENLAPVTAGRFFLHGSHDRHRRRAGGISLEIDAGTAFGTGHHATTRGCLLALDALLKWARPRRILDIGCGTGILALAAARALHVPVIASDIDPEAVRVTLANARANGARCALRAVTAPDLAHPLIRKDAPFDLIFANILARPLVGLSGSVSRALAPRGVLILSGLTVDQSPTVAAAYRNRGLAQLRGLSLDSWSTLVLIKANTRSKRSGC